MRFVKYTGRADRATVTLDGKFYEFGREGTTEVTNKAGEELLESGDARFEVYDEDGGRLVLEEPEPDLGDEPTDDGDEDGLDEE